jgi:hypothetical protein
MYVDVPHLDCLLVAALITVEGLDPGGPQGKSEDQPHAKQSAPADCTDMAM